MESVTVGRGGCRVMGKAPIGTSPAAWSSATVGEGGDGEENWRTNRC